MIGFFNGTIRDTFDLKPRREFVPDDDVDADARRWGIGKKILVGFVMCAVVRGIILKVNEGSKDPPAM